MYFNIILMQVLRVFTGLIRPTTTIKCIKKHICHDLGVRDMMIMSNELT